MPQSPHLSTVGMHRFRLTSLLSHCTDRLVCYLLPTISWVFILLLKLKSFLQAVIKLSPAVRGFSTSDVMKAKPAGAHGDHTKLWTLEKGVAAGILVALPLGIMYPNILFDLIMAVGVVMHTHW
jgi:hypothetical protein